LFKFNKNKNTADLLVFKSSKNPSRQNSIHKGRIRFTYDKRKLRPYRYEERTGNSYKFRRDSEVIKLLQDATLLLTTPNDKPENVSEYLEFFENKKMPTPKIMKLCERCLQESNQMSQITDKNSYKLYKKLVCRVCAIEEIQDEYSRRGIALTSSSKKFYIEQLKSYKQLDNIIENLWDPKTDDKEKSTSLFDIIPADRSSKAINIGKFINNNGLKDVFDKEIVNNWNKNSLHDFLPVQQLAIKKGLLELNDLLVVAGTSSGKTFIGEIAGLHNWKSRGKKFVFVTPLIALSNQKYESFKKRYRGLGARVALRVGMSKIDVGGEEKIYPDGNFAKSDIVVGTYEAIDWIFRSGQWKNIGEIGTFVIDEVQLLSDPERGIILDGIISRVRLLFPKCQIICLSATIGNPKELAEELGLSLVEYMHRPIPLERHLIISTNDEERINHISQFVRNETKILSKSNHKGQTLVFTNSRKRVQELASQLKTTRIRSAYYHAGMTYINRKKIETKFENGELDVVTTTAALGAGADFPVSQVIFEKPAMGARWITNAEYHQMTGRAGRFGFHDMGKSIMFVVPGEKIYSAQKNSSDQVAFEILTGDIEPVEGDIDLEDEMDQILAFISASYPIKHATLTKYHNILFFKTNSLNSILKSLSSKGLISNENDLWYITALGRAISSSFLKPSFGFEIAKKTIKFPIEEVAIEIAPIETMLLSSQIHSQMERAMKTNLSRKFLSDAILDFVVGSSYKSKNIPITLVERVKQWNRLFFDCNCKINPYCIHPKIKLSKLLLDLRLSGLNISQMTYDLSRNYDLFIYPGDLLSWLDEIIHAIQSVARLAKAMKNNKILIESKQLALAIQSANPKYMDKEIKFFNTENQKPKNTRSRKKTTNRRKTGIVRKKLKSSKISRKK
jgi:helicase